MFGKKMHLRSKGMGFLGILVPVLTYIPLRLIIGAWEETHHAAVVAMSLSLSGIILFYIALQLDRKTGIDPLSSAAWTSDLLESQHIFMALPLRLAAAIMLVASAVVMFL